MDSISQYYYFYWIWSNKYHTNPNNLNSSVYICIPKCIWLKHSNDVQYYYNLKYFFHFNTFLLLE